MKMADDKRASRIDKLRSIPPDHLLLIAREWVVSRGYNNYNTSVAHVTKVLESAAARGSEESGWLLDKLRSKGAIPEFGTWQVNRRWLAEVMASDESPRAQYYRGLALWWLGDKDAGLKLLRQSAEAGFAPAMSWLGVALAEGEEKMAWLRKAAKLNDPDGLFWLSNRVEEERFELLCKAAAQGHTQSIGCLVSEFSDRLSPVEVAAFGTRFVLYSGWTAYVEPIIRAAAQQMDNKQACANDLAVLCAAGRELEGYDQLWDADKHPHDSYLQCIDVHLTVTHRARRAALQAVTGLRQYLGRDVARLIGKMVYDTRQTEAHTWWLPQQSNDNKKLKISH
jgi:hypothetical protein